MHRCGVFGDRRGGRLRTRHVSLIRRTFAMQAGARTQLEARCMLTTLASGQEVLDSFNAGSSESFDFHANAGDSIRVSVGETGDLSGQVFLQLFNPSGQLVTSDNGNDDAVIQISNAVAGSYTAVVTESNNDAPLSFRIRAATFPGSQQLIGRRDEALSSGEEVHSSLPLGTFNVFPISASAGDSLRISVGETGDFSAQPFMWVFGPAGELVDTDNGNDDAVVEIANAQAGTYTAVVADSNNDQPMSFRIRAVMLPSNPQLIAGRDVALANGEEVESSFPLGSFNVFPIAANAGDTIRVSVGELEDFSAQPYLQLFDPAGVLVNSDNGSDDAIVQIANAQAGTYTAVVSESSNDQPMVFRIRAASLSGSIQLIGGRDAALANGEEVESSFPFGSFNVFPINANAGDTLRVSVGETSGLSAQPYLQLFDPTGFLVTSDNSNNDAEVQITTALAGTYTAVVFDGNNEDPMSFRIRAATLPGNPQLISGRDVALTNGQEVESSFPLGMFNVFPIAANAGDSIRVSVGETGDLSAQPYLWLYDPAGQLVTTDNSSHDAVVQIADAQAGTYTAVVVDNGNNDPMSFRIRAVTVPGTPQLIGGRDAALANGEEVESSLPLGGFNVFTIAANANDSLRVSVGEYVQFDAQPYLWLFDPTGLLIDSDNGGDDAVVQIANAQAGTYTAVVADSNNDEFMSFRIRAVTLPDNPLLLTGRDVALANGEEVESSFPLGSFNVFPIAASTGGTIRVSVGETGDLSAQPSLQLFDPTGLLIDSDNSNHDAFVQITGAQAGIYTAVVADSNNDDPMSFRIRAIALPGNPLAIASRDTNLTSGQIWESTFPVGSFNHYRFDARTGDDIEIEVTGIGGSGQPFFEVFNPAGQYLTGDNGSVVADVPFEAATSGIYTVIVSDSGNNEPLDHSIVVNGATGNFEPIRSTPLFYENSAFDLTSDDAAIANKQPLQMGDTSSFVNFTSYLNGVNGIMIDLADAPNPGAIGPADFTFRTGTSSDTSTWTELATDPAIQLRSGEGGDGSDRLVLTWASGAARDTWLEVTLHVTPNTGLSADHVFYYGNKVGDANGDGQVNATDYVAVRANPATFLNPAAVDNLFDFDRDGRVNAIDLSIIRDHATILGGGLPMITPSVGSGLLGIAEDNFAAMGLLSEAESNAKSLPTPEGEGKPVAELLTPATDDHRILWLEAATQLEQKKSRHLKFDDTESPLDAKWFDQLLSDTCPVSGKALG